MRCSPKLFIGLLIVGIGGAAILSYLGNTQAAYILSLLPFLACPIMCVFMMVTGRDCQDGSCHTDKKKRTASLPPHNHADT